MTHKGIIKKFSAHTVSKKYMTVDLYVLLPVTGEHVDIKLEGTMTDICSKLNTIPINGTVTGKHLKEAKCTVYNERGQFRFISLDPVTDLLAE